MPGPEEEGVQARPSSEPLGFSIEKQKVELDLDFASCSVKGRTTITISPQKQDLETLRLDCRNLTITHTSVENKRVTTRCHDPYNVLAHRRNAGVRQHHFLKNAVNQALATSTEDGELQITLPKKFKIEKIDGYTAVATHNMDLASTNADSKPRRSVDGAETPAPRTATDDAGSYFAPFTVYIEYEIRSLRDGLHFVGMGEDDSRYPQAFTRNSMLPGSACCWFPCLDNFENRTSFELHVRAPRTLGDVFTESMKPAVNGTAVNGTSHVDDVTMSEASENRSARLTQAERGLEMMAIGSGNLEDEIVDPNDPTKKTTSFKCDAPILARHLGFAIGPFEHVNLSEFREEDEDDMLGANAVPVHGFCLPGRSEEVINVCMPLANTVDHFTTDYNTFAFSSYKLVFVDDLPVDVADTASLSICSNRLLFPPEIIDPIDSVTRTLVHAAASQWIGVHIIPKEADDLWVIVGLSYFMTDRFLEELCGRNEIRFRQKMANDKLFALDINRPSIHALGPVLHLDPSELEFMQLKAPLVLWILHNRVRKGNPTSGVHRMLWRTMANSTSGQLPNDALSTAEFIRVCEKFVHGKMDPFFNQWVYGAGCPHFWCTQKWNKKKTCIDMTITQIQGNQSAVKAGHDRNLDPREFHREVKEEKNEVYAAGIQPLFTGGLTLRVHEADGTPYEHAMQVMETNHKLEVQYHTKYKRLKKTRRQKERAAQQAAAGGGSGEDKDEKVLYCLGDVLKSDEDLTEWRLADWSIEDEAAMNDQSFEWLRFDSDFEWLGKCEINQPIYMWASQLQQDRDVMAQVEALQWMANAPKQPVMATICVKTLLDTRYFYGIRAMACDILAQLATEQHDWLGLFHLEKVFQELYCLPGNTAPRSNDFSDRAAYIIQCAIPRAMAKIRDKSGTCPMQVKRFLLEKIKLNDNAENEYSDVHYISTLLSCLSHSLTSTIDRARKQQFSFEDDEEDIEADTAELEFLRLAIAELDRYRRMDEWMPTWRNTYTVATLECFRLLMEGKVIPQHLSEFMSYTRMDNSEDVRLKALHCLVDRGCLRSPDFMRFFLYNYQSESSPYFRRRIWQILGEGLGRIAMGIDKPSTPDAPPTGGLIIEQDSSTEKRAQELARLKDIHAALGALKKELGGLDMLDQGLQDCLASPHLTLAEFVNLIELCGILFDTTDEFPVTLKYPRYWEATKVGKGDTFNGIVKFSKTSRIRTKPMPRVDLPAIPMGPPPKPQAHKPSAPKRKASSAFPEDVEGSSLSRQPSLSLPEKTSMIVNLKVPNKKQKLAAITGGSAASSMSRSPSIQASSPTPSPFRPFNKSRQNSSSASPKPVVNGSGSKLNGAHPTPAQSDPAVQPPKQKLKLKFSAKPSTPR